MIRVLPAHAPQIWAPSEKLSRCSARIRCESFARRSPAVFGHSGNGRRAGDLSALVRDMFALARTRPNPIKERLPERIFFVFATHPAQLFAVSALIVLPAHAPQTLTRLVKLGCCSTRIHRNPSCVDPLPLRDSTNMGAGPETFRTRPQHLRAQAHPKTNATPQMNVSCLRGHSSANPHRHRRQSDAGAGAANPGSARKLESSPRADSLEILCASITCC